MKWLEPANTGPPIFDYDVQFRAGTSGPFWDEDHAGTRREATIQALTEGVSYQVRVRANNAEGPGEWSEVGTATARLNTAPVFDQGSYGFTLAENADGRTTAIDVGTVSATDADDHTLSYEIAAGNTGGVFAIDADGRITYTGGGEDHETTPSFSLTVRAIDTLNGSDDAVVTVTVTDVNEPPAFDTEGLTVDTSGTVLFSVADDTTAVSTLTAVDPDAADTVVTYVLGGTDRGLFSISNTGVVAFVDEPDFDNPQGGASDDSNEYAFSVTASAGVGPRAMSRTLDVKVTVTDALDTGSPMLSSAAVNGARLVLTYHEALDEDSVPDRGAFTVEVNGSEVRLATSNAVAVSGRAVTVRLRGAVAHDDTVTVSYTAPATNPIRDPAGHAAADLSNQAVTNITDDTTAPALRSATITDATLVLRYDEALDESSVPAASAFEVWVAGARVSAGDVTVEGRAVRLTLASAAAHGDTVSVYYAPPSANPIRDPAGNAAAKVGHRVVTNNTPERGDTTAPALRSATITDATLVLRYDEALDEDSVPAASALTVEVNGGEVRLATSNAVAVRGSAVTVRLRRAVARGDAVTVSYAAPSAGPIRDPAGNAAANLSNRTVTNDTPAPGDTTAPTLSSATITDDRITLTYDEPLDANSVPAAGAFRATTRGSFMEFTNVDFSVKVDKVAVAGRTVTLTLRPSQMTCGAATVSYRVPGAYPIQDTSGNAAAGFDERAVTSAPNAPGITVTAPTPTPLPEGRSATFTVKLDAMPCGHVNLSLSSDDPDVRVPHHTLLSFAKVTGRGRWDVPQEVRVWAAQDHDAADETATITLRVRDESPAEWRALADVTVTVEVADDDVAALSVADARVAEGPGATLDFRVTLDRERHLPVTVDYATSDGTAVAGEDYEAASGTLAFQAGETAKTVRVTVLDDAVDEGEETMTFTLSNASEAVIADGEAVGTIENSDAIPKAWIARFGRTVADQVLEAVESRMEATRQAGGETQVTLAGERIGGGTVDEESRREAEALREAERLTRWLGDETEPEEERDRAVAQRDLLIGSSFSMTAANDEAGSVSFWGRGAVSRFDGREGDLTLDGEVTSGLLGADWSRERWTAGLIVSHSAAEGGYRGGVGASGSGSGTGGGAVEATLTGLHPWGLLRLTEGLEAWGAAGHGWGELTVTPDGDGPALRTDLELTMGAAGLRGELLGPGSAGGENAGPSLALVTDALAVRTESDAVRGAEGNLAAARATVTRLRLGLEGSWAHALDGGGTLTPSLEVGVRHDGGDAETGAGLELGGGLSWTDPSLGLTAEVSGRTLAAHADEGYREWGAGGSLSLDPGAGGRGLSLRLAPTWGTPEGGAERLRQGDAGALAALAANGNAANDNALAPMRLDTELGYGLEAAGGHGTLTPFVGFSLAGEDARDWRLGTRFELGPSLDLSLEGTRRESDGAEPEHGLGFRLQATW